MGHQRRPVAMTATRAIYASAGAPAQSGTDAGGCRLCGASGVGVAWADWVKETFTDHDRVWPGAIVCQACLFCTDDHSTVLQQRTRRDKPQRMRNYSHVVTMSGRWLPLMKNEKRTLTAALLDTADPPIVAVISLAGQKHLVTRARVGWWQIEEQTVRPDPEGLAQLLPPIVALYSAGATKGMIESGQYSAGVLRQLDLAAWQAAERVLRPSRGSWLFALGVWLAQKEETDDRDARHGPRQEA